MTFPYRVYVSPHGSQFQDEIAELLATALTDLGRSATVVRDGLPEASRRHVNLVVAPQDYFDFSVLHGRSKAEVLRAAAASVAVNTEQPGQVWYDRAFPYLSQSPLTLDINAYAADHLIAGGYPARHLRWGYHPSRDRWGGDPNRPRPVDIGFLGAMYERRDRFLVEAASRLWDHSCDLRLFEITRPKRAGDPNFLAGAAKLDWLARAKVLLNVHQSTVPYFEWARIIEALSNGCVVVSEPSTHVAPLRPGEHFVEAPIDLLADYAVGLLVDPEDRTKMAVAAYDLARTELRLTDALAPLLDEAEMTIRSRPAGQWPQVYTGARCRCGVGHDIGRC